jgi:hypothetical protein
MIHDGELIPKLDCGDEAFMRLEDVIALGVGRGLIRAGYTVLW